MSEIPAEITRLLAEAHAGRAEALDEVMELLYADLRRIAQHQLKRRYGSARGQVSIEPTELVNEAFLKLIRQRKQYDSRGHFFAIASRVMVRVLMDYGRAKKRGKRGEDPLRVSLSKVQREMASEPDFAISDFVEALERLEAMAPRTAEVTKLRLLWGLTLRETSEAMELSSSTVEREWRFGSRWLAAELGSK